MSGLVLKLGPKERVLINGAVIENGERRSRLSIVTPNANILRLRDAIHPEEVTTPVRRVCYIAQLVLSGDAEATDARPQLLRGIEQLSQALRDLGVGGARAPLPHRHEDGGHVPVATQATLRHGDGHEDGVVTFGQTAEEAGTVLLHYLAQAIKLDFLPNDAD